MLKFAKNADTIDLHPTLSPNLEVAAERNKANKILTQLIF